MTCDVVALLIGDSLRGGRIVPKAAFYEKTGLPLAVSVVYLDIPFPSLVWLMTKMILAALPALLIAAVIVISILGALAQIVHPH